MTGISPVNRVNAVCQGLEKRGAIVRIQEGKGYRNQLIQAQAVEGLAVTGRSDSRSRPSVSSVPIKSDLEKTLIVIPCSAAKRVGGKPGITGPSFVSSIPVPLQAQLRSKQQLGTVQNPAVLMPAWQRYDGKFYNAPGVKSAFGFASKNNYHLIVLSGGYGPIFFDESIAWYDQSLRSSDWGITITDVLASYASNHGIKHVRVITSGAYRQVVLRGKPVLRQGIWTKAGVIDGVVLSPIGGGQHNVPVAEGCAFAALIQGGLHAQWVCPVTGLALTRTPLF